MKNVIRILISGIVLFGAACARSADLKLQEGTPVRLRLKQTLSSAHAVVDDRVYFEAVDETKLNGIVVIPRGSLAVATVTEAEAKKRLGRGGKLNLNIDFVRLANGAQCPLRARKTSDHTNHYGREVTEVAVTGLLFWPAAPLFLLQHGKDVKIPEGTEITAYVASDIVLNTETGALIQTTAATPEAPKYKVEPKAQKAQSANSIDAEEGAFKSVWHMTKEGKE